MGSFSLRDKSFLVVDDHNFSRITILRTLNNIGVSNTFSATNGTEALSILEDGEQHVDCVITDFNMPIMHGLQLLKAIRTGYHGIRNDIPVIMATGHAEKDLVLLALALDVHAFLLKPIVKEELQEKLKSLFNDDSFVVPPVELYACFNVEAPISELLKRPTLAMESVWDKGNMRLNALYVDEINKRGGAPVRACSLEEIPLDSLLAHDVICANGQRILIRGTKLSQTVIHKLRDLDKLGFHAEKIWIMDSQPV
jgi:two-component system chemotaxis response regulator CheY